MSTIVRYSTSFGSNGSGNGQFVQPEGVCATSDGVWVADYGNSRIQRFTHEGAYTSKFTCARRPWRVQVADGLVYVAFNDGTTYGIDVYTLAGVLTRTIITSTAPASTPQYDFKVENGRIYAPLGPNIRCYDLAGSSLWLKQVASDWVVGFGIESDTSFWVAAGTPAYAYQFGYITFYRWNPVSGVVTPLVYSTGGRYYSRAAGACHFGLGMLWVPSIWERYPFNILNPNTYVSSLNNYGSMLSLDSGSIAEQGRDSPPGDVMAPRATAGYGRYIYLAEAGNHRIDIFLAPGGCTRTARHPFGRRLTARVDWDGALSVHRWSDTVPEALGAAVAVEASGVNVCSLGIRPCGTTDLIYDVGDTVYHRVSRDMGASFGVASTIATGYRHPSAALDKRTGLMGCMMQSIISGYWYITVGKLNAAGTAWTWCAPVSVVAGADEPGQLRCEPDGSWTFVYSTPGGAQTLIRCKSLTSAGAGAWS